MTENWELKYKKLIKDKEELRSLLLINRGITSKKDRQNFISPPLPGIFSAHDIGINQEELEKSVQRIKHAIGKKELIVVFGDYDADGICATAILWRALHKLGAKVFPYIPDRFEDGYGINPESVKKIKNTYPETSLIVTVDNGIVAFAGVKQAKDLGMDVIITDHHAAKDKLPEVFSIVHTTQTSGAGISWFLSSILLGFGQDLELAAIGVIADQLPLLGFNRSIAKYGIAALGKTNITGLKKLYVTAGLIGKKIGTYEINFAIAPRLNAAGRLAEGIDALRLLCTTDSKRAEKLATLINELNIKRQNTVDRAISLAEATTEISSGAVIMAMSKEYHEGVIGLIASRLSEKHYLPAIVFSLKDDIAKASARSISGINIIQIIREAEEYILEGGGHAGAAGFTIEIDKIEIFSRKIQSVAKPLLTADVLKRKTVIDCELEFSLLNQETYEVINGFEPFGIGNPGPVFMSKGVEILRVSEVGSDGKHKKLQLKKDGHTIEGIIFNFPEKLKLGFVDIVYKLSLNEWRGKTKLELVVKDIKHE